MSNRNKPSIIKDQLSQYNSIGISITESWLDSEISDTEVQIEGYTLFRADRKGRSRGGAACFMKSDLNCVIYEEYSNGVVEYLIVKCKVLDVLIVTVYRPPDTSNSEWSDAVIKLESAVTMAQSNGDYKSLLITGDFNMRNLKWNNGMICIQKNMTSRKKSSL